MKQNIANQKIILWPYLFPSKLDNTKSSRIKLSNSESDPPNKSKGKLPKLDSGSIGGGTFKFVAWLGLTPFSSKSKSRFKS